MKNKNTTTLGATLMNPKVKINPAKILSKKEREKQFKERVGAELDILKDKGMQNGNIGGG